MATWSAMTGTFGELGDHPFHVQLHGRVDHVGAGLLRRPDDRIDLLDEIREVAVEAALAVRLDGGLHRAAALVADNDQQRHRQVLDGVLDRPDHRPVGDLAGGSRDEQIPESLVEQHLRGHPRVGAGQDARERFLPAGQPLGLGDGMDADRLAVDEPAVALDQLGERVVGREGPVRALRHGLGFG